MQFRAVSTWLALVFACLWGLGLGLADWSGLWRPLEQLEAVLIDARTLLHGARTPPPAVTIVAIDDATAETTGTYPISREALARIVSSAAKLGAKAVALDILLVDQGPKAGDRALGQALAASPGIIAAAAIYAQEPPVAGLRPLAGIPQAQRILMPREEFAAAAKIGIVNVVADSTGTPRYVPLLFGRGTETYASLALQATATALGIDPVIEPSQLLLGQRAVATDAGYLLPIDYYGPRGSIKTVSASTALDGTLPRDLIEGRVVVVGATVTGGGDVFHTPFDPLLPGVEVIATAITQLMAGDGLVRDGRTRAFDLAIAVAMPALLVGLLAWRRSAMGFGLIAVVITLWFSATALAFAHGIWLSAALPLAAALPPALAFGVSQITLGRRQEARLRKESALMQKFQSPVLARWLIDHPDFLMQPVGQQAAVVFVDLSGFTGLSEELGPQAVRELLKGFHDLMEEEVGSAGGIVIDFTGDGAMIVFGLPSPRQIDAARAAQCCVALATRLRQWIAAQPKEISSRLGFKIGAHAGEAVASRLGGQSHQQIAMTGDTVNLANRLMNVAAQRGAALAVSDAFMHSAGAENALHTSGRLEGPLDTDIRGRTGMLSIWLWREAL